MSFIRHLLPTISIRQVCQPPSKIDKDEIAWICAIFLMIAAGFFLIVGFVSMVTITEQTSNLSKITEWQHSGFTQREILLIAANNQVDLTPSISPFHYVLTRLGLWILIACAACFLSVPITRRISKAYRYAVCDKYHIPYKCRHPRKHKMYHVSYNECPCGAKRI